MIVTGYHGTTKAVADRILSGSETFRIGSNLGDWLGRGAYFWQDAPMRGYLWAKHRHPTEELAVIAADIDLVDCFDLFDVPAHNELKRVYPRFARAEEVTGPVTTQDELRVGDGYVFTKNDPSPIVARTDQYITFRDRALIDWYLEELRIRGIRTASVRGIFLVGKSAYKESFLFNWSNAQIAVLDDSVISNPRIVDPRHGGSVARTFGTSP